jgi:hypothetical protein
VERKNLDLQGMFKKLLGGQIQDWVCYIPFVQLAYNARISTHTGSTAFSLMFGRAVRAFGTNMTVDQEFDLKQWQAQQEKMTVLIYPSIHERVQNQNKKQAERFNEKHKISAPIAPGSVEYVKDDTEKSKWVNENNGPFKVVRQTRGGAYILEDRTGAVLTTRFPPKLLKVVPQADFLPEGRVRSYYVQKILDDDKLATGSHRYLVKFKKLKEPQWLVASAFDGSIMIAKYWKKKLQKKSTSWCG